MYEFENHFTDKTKVRPVTNRTCSCFGPHMVSVKCHHNHHPHAFWCASCVAVRQGLCWPGHPSRLSAVHFRHFFAWPVNILTYWEQSNKELLIASWQKGRDVTAPAWGKFFYHWQESLCKQQNSVFECCHLQQHHRTVPQLRWDSNPAVKPFPVMVYQCPSAQYSFISASFDTLTDLTQFAWHEICLSAWCQQNCINGICTLCMTSKTAVNKRPCTATACPPLMCPVKKSQCPLPSPCGNITGDVLFFIMPVPCVPQVHMEVSLHLRDLSINSWNELNTNPLNGNNLYRLTLACWLWLAHDTQLNCMQRLSWLLEAWCQPSAHSRNYCGGGHGPQECLVYHIRYWAEQGNRCADTAIAIVNIVLHIVCASLHAWCKTWTGQQNVVSPEIQCARRSHS